MGDGAGHGLQRLQAFDEGVQQLVVESFFPGQGARFGAQHLVFEGFEFRGDVTFDGFERLAAGVIGWRLGRSAFGDFNAVAVHAVVG